MSDHDPASRSVALDAVIRTAIDRGSGRFTRSFRTSAVSANVDGETTNRTIRRALKDAEALGWVVAVDGRDDKWKPGERTVAIGD